MYKRDIGKKDEFAQSFSQDLKRGDRKKFLPVLLTSMSSSRECLVHSWQSNFPFGCATESMAS